MESECVSCGACVQACPTATLTEKTVIMMGQAEHSKVTTCAYCGVGCAFKAEMKGNEVVRMVPYKDGKANHGHCLRQGPLRLGLRNPQGPHHQADDPQQDHRSMARSVVGGGDRLRRLRVPPHPGQARPDSIGGITSSRCTNEETYLVQKLVRAAFGNNNVDTCARVATRRPATASSRRWANRPAPRFRFRR
jgi:formate dehydrogenase major subunit